MAVTTKQKVDFLLKKIGYTKTKTGLADDETLSGTKKAGFAEANASPLVIASTSVWADSSLIPATPPGSDSATVKRYPSGTAYRMTYDNTVAGNRAFIARSTQGDQTASIDGDWIDTQFGNNYLIKVYKGDPNASGVELSAAGSGSNDAWFFDYSTGVLNFNDTNVPTGITTNNVYLVGYRYTGKKGILPPVGFGTFSSLDVTGIATFRDDVQLHGVNAGVTSAYWDKSANEFKFIDNTKLSFGTGQDLNLFHGGTASYISHSGTGYLAVDADIIAIRKQNQQKYFLGQNGAATLYNGGSERLITTGYGVSVYGGQTGIGTIGAPAILHIDPAAVGDNTGLVVIKGNLQVDGTQTTVNSATMTVTDKNIEIAKGAANDAAADGAGITIDSGSGDKTWNWLDATNAWTSSENIHVAAGKVLGFADDTNTYIDRPAADTIRFTTGGTTSVTIDENHKVGIGSDDPDAWLHIQTVSTTGDEDLIKLSRNQYEVGKIRRSAGNMKVSGEGNLYLESDYNADHGATDSNIIFTTDGDEKVRITKDGELGINTTTGDGLINTLNTGVNQQILQFKVNLPSHSNRKLNLFGPETDSTSDYFRFQTGDAIKFQIEAIDALCINASGLVGIHTTIPTAKLDVIGNTKLQGTLNVTGVSTFTGAIDANGDLDVDGNSELDTVNIAETLNVVGVSTFNANVHLLDNDRLRIGGSAGTFDGLELYHEGSHSYINDSGTGDLKINGSGIEILSAADSVRIGSVLAYQTQLFYANALRFSSSGIGVTVTGQLDTTNIKATGITTTGTLNIGITGHTMVGINTVLDEDNMASDSATALATQQSIKKYIDDRSPAGPGGGNLAVSADSGSNESINLNTEVLDIEGTANEIETATGTNKVVIGLPNDVTVSKALIVGAGLNVTGVSTFASNVFLGDDDRIIFGDGGLSDAHVRYDGSHLQFGVASGSFRVSADTASFVNYAGNQTLTTINSTGVTIPKNLDVDGYTELDDLNVSGVSTFAGAIDANGNLDVDGYTELDDLNVSGVSTFAGAIDANGNLDVDGYTELDDLNVSGVSTFASNVDVNASADISGNLVVGAGGTTITTVVGAAASVGIGDASPSYMLDVAGAINSQTDVKVNGVSVAEQALNDAVAMAIALG